MRKRGPKSFYHKEETIMMPPRESEAKEPGLARWEYQRLENELSDIYHRTIDVLATLNRANPSEYTRLAKIIENSLEELRIRIHEKAVFEFPELANREKRKISASIPKENAISVDQSDENNIRWEDLCRLEPELLELWSEAKEVKDSGRRKSFCAYDYFKENIADRLTELLGPWNEREIQVLNNIKALDMAKDTILEALPPCRNCKQHQSKQQNMQDSK